MELATINIDPEFAALIPPLQDDEYSLRWYTALIRQLFKPSTERESCCVCGKYKSISESHHVIPVSEMAALCHKTQMRIDDMVKMSVPLAWLCPNHHAIYHAIMGMKSKQTSTAKLDEIISDIGLDEYRMMKPLYDLYEEKFAAFGSFLLECCRD